MIESACALRIDTALARAGAFVRAQNGWRRSMLAFGAGAISAFAFAPFGFFPLLLVALAIFVLLIDGAHAHAHPRTRAAWAGWWWGFGQFLIGLYWVGNAFLVDAAAHAWQIPLVEVLLPGGLALFFAAAGAICAAWWRPGPSRIFLFALIYSVAEWLRGHVLTGFPWNLPAYGWEAVPGILQSAALFGAYGLSLLTVLFGASLAQCCEGRGHRQLPAAMAGLFLCLGLGGEARLAMVAPADVPGVRLRLVQPDVPQAEKYVAGLRLRNWWRLVDLTRKAASIPPTLVIWPEAAPPILLNRTPEALEEIAFLTGSRRVLVTGAVRTQASVDGGVRVFNSVLVFGHAGALVVTYDKFHLVPFGEYVPFESLLERLGITRLVDGPDGFSTGDGPHTVDIPGAPPAGILICYEIIFPGAAVGVPRPGWLINVTDDSWFGTWVGPYQHFAIARLRAIEEGLPVARAANTGISAVIDPLGRVRARLGVGRFGIVDSPLPAVAPKTPFARLGDTGFLLLLLVCAWGVRRR